MRPGYKKTEVGEIPEDWGVVRLSAAAEFLDGLRRPVKMSDRAKMRGAYPYYGASGIVDYVNDFLFDDDLILLGEDGENILSRNTRLAFRVSGKVWVNNHAHVLKPKPDFEIGFLCDYLESLDYSLLNSGTAQPKLNKKACESIQVPKPTPEEQKVIARALSDVDELIANLEKQIAKKRDIKTATMQQLLTGKKRLSGFGEGKGYKQSDLGEIPEDWKVGLIGELLSITTGGRNTQDKVSDGTYPFYVRSQNVERIDTFSFDGEGVLTAGDGVGTGKIFHYVNGKFDFHQRVYLMHNFSDDLSARYFFIFFSEYFYARIMSMTAKSSVDSVRREMIAGMPIFLPEPEEQEAIASVLFDMDSELCELKTKLSKAKAIKTGMMQELLTGKTRLV